MHFRWTRVFGLWMLCLGQAQAQIFTNDQYVKALWMATRFFGAQRSGEGPNWILQDTPFPKSFVKDSYNGQDISGGWFDCGDHVMFGQTQFYATYMLARAMVSFPNGWYDLYDGTSYADYKASQNYGMEGGKPNGLPDILEELRYAADFIVKITPNAQTFILQKGDGNLDHKNWVTAGKMATLTRDQGGESDGPRMVVANPQDGFAAGLASATLAIMARSDPDAARRAKYLTHAQNAYQYSMTHSGVASAPGGFYQATWWDKRWREARVLAAFELYETTGNPSYLDAARAEFDQMELGIYNRLEYTNLIPLARILGLKYLDDAGANLDFYLRELRSGTNAEGVSTKYSYSEDFATRGPVGAAAIHAFKAVQENAADYDAFIFSQVDYVLGRNSKDQAYLVGWDETDKNGRKKKMPTKPHHRGYYGNTDLSKSDSYFNSVDAPAKNKYLGGLVGGSFTGDYVADVVNWRFNEVCSDMNATLVAALGYLVHRYAPAAQPIPVVPARALSPSWGVIRHGRAVEIFGLRSGDRVEIADSRGRLWTVLRGDGAARWEAPRAGTYVMRWRSQAQSRSQMLVLGDW